MSQFKFFLFVFVTLVFSNMFAAKDLPKSSEETLEVPFKDTSVLCGAVITEVVTCNNCTHQLICKPKQKGILEKCPEDKSYCHIGKCDSKPGPLCGSIHTKTIFQ